MDLEHLTLDSAIQIITEARYAIAAVYCLQLYEWIATAKREVDLVHHSRWSSVKIAYLLCRYYPLFIWPLVMFAYIGDHTWAVCRRLTAPVHVLLAPCQVFPQAVMLMRAYAFCGRNKHVLALLLTCYAGLVAVVIWSFCTHIMILPRIVFSFLGNTGCYPYYGKGYMGFRVGYSMLAATLMDMISLLCVLVRCALNKSRQISLARYFIKQGLFSFCLVVAVNVSAAGVFFDQDSPHNGLGLPFILVVSNLIACRIILDLRRKVRPTDSEIAMQHSRIVRDGLRTRTYDRAEDEWLMEDDDSEDCR
ncbi:hypothetical protein LshimejAT787_1001730 [Lyophyllum shimeji]|uniref:DUF6533 domain-containing protein n=1 Tax=Lyophyllum shimeji TaxID=47721 RepID=A0A9P3UQD5_LYOSH|nr:hypothetical protein LshimejAT787_1001730 [Lyophyllum shimeji]